MSLTDLEKVWSQYCKTLKPGLHELYFTACTHYNLSQENRLNTAKWKWLHVLQVTAAVRIKGQLPRSYCRWYLAPRAVFYCRLTYSTWSQLNFYDLFLLFVSLCSGIIFEMELDSEQIIVEVETVSYTHLDVYKRQV